MPHASAQSNGEHAKLLAAAERVLTDRWGATLRFGEVQQLSEPRRRNLLLRCGLLEGPPDAPTSVMLKRARRRRNDPDDPNSRPAVGLFRDWAGLEFLNTLGPELKACPKFYGGDREAGFLVMEDLGAGQDLDHVLTCGSAEQARRTLARLAESLGRMHAMTAGRHDEYQQIRDALGPGDQMHRSRLADHARDYAPDLAERCEKLGVDVASGYLDDVETVARAMAEPGPFLTYTHADACPDNSLLVGERLCLIDYEFGGFRHAMLDGVYGWIRFPTCWCVRDIPQAVLTEMETAYRRELVKGCPAAADDARYFRGVADACAYWMLETLAHLLSRAALYEEPKGISTNRQRILVRLAAFIQVADRSGHLQDLRQTLASLLEELRRRWRDDMPPYDAFGIRAEMSEEDVCQIVDAVRRGQTDHVARLLDANPALAKAKAPDADQTPVLYLAVDTRDTELVRLLLESGADWRVSTRSGWTVLARACSHSTSEIVDLLLDRGADLNERDSWGTLPLYGALGNRTMMLHLLKSGATADVKMAIDMDRLDVARRLLTEDPPRARIRYGTGLTLLHDSARVGDTRTDAIKLLLSYEADVNAVTNWGATPLHLAVFHGNARIAAILIDHGSQLHIEDNYGLTPLGVAKAANHVSCVELLRDRIERAEEPPEQSAAGFHTAFHTVVAGAGADRPEPNPEDRDTSPDEQIAKIDELYRQHGRSRDSEPHPMDEIAAGLLFERLAKQRDPLGARRNARGEP